MYPYHRLVLRVATRCWNGHWFHCFRLFHVLRSTTIPVDVAGLTDGTRRFSFLFCIADGAFVNENAEKRNAVFGSLEVTFLCFGWTLCCLLFSTLGPALRQEEGLDLNAL